MNSAASTSPSKQRPSVGRIALAVAYLAILSFVFYWSSWWIVINYVWFRFEYQYLPPGSVPLTTFEKVRATLAAGVTWLIIVGVSWTFVTRLFSSVHPLYVLTRQVLSGIVMAGVAHSICDFTFWNFRIPVPHPPVYEWIPDYSLIPFYGAFIIFLLGSTVIPDFPGYPIWKHVPASWKQRLRTSVLTIRNLKVPRPKAPNRWGGLTQHAVLLATTSLRTAVLLYLFPLLASGVVILLATLVALRGSWFVPNSAFLFVSAPVLCVCAVLLYVKVPNWGFNRLLVGIAAAAGVFCWLVLYNGSSASTMKATYTLAAITGLLATVVAAVRWHDTSKEFFGSRNDPLFLGISTELGIAFQMYLMMCWRMLRPYIIALLPFIIAAMVSLHTDAKWSIILWPVASALNYWAFRHAVWFEAAPFHYKNLQPGSSKIPDFVES